MHDGGIRPARYTTECRSRAAVVTSEGSHDRPAACQTAIVERPNANAAGPCPQGCPSSHHTLGRHSDREAGVPAISRRMVRPGPRRSRRITWGEGRRCGPTSGRAVAEVAGGSPPASAGSAPRPSPALANSSGGRATVATAQVTTRNRSAVLWRDAARRTRRVLSAGTTAATAVGHRSHDRRCAVEVGTR